MKHKINNKKILVVVIIAIAFIAVALQQMAVVMAESITTEKIGEQKIICKATVEDDFADDKVIVTLKQAASLEFYKD